MWARVLCSFGFSSGFFAVMDNIGGRRKSFSITEEKEVVFGVSDEVMKKGKSVVKWGLLGKLLVNKL